MATQEQRKRGGGCLRVIGIGTVVLIVLIVLIVLYVRSANEEGTATTGDGDASGQTSAEGWAAAVGDTVELKGTSDKVTRVRTA